MTAEEIEKYEYCKTYLAFVARWKEEMPVKRQHHGCGSQRPNIEHALERIHVEMYQSICVALREAETNVNQIIEKI